MKTNRKRCIVLTVLFSILVALLGISGGVYANTTLSEIATQNDFHLSTSPVVEFNLNNTTSDNSSITGNLFTFTHTIPDPDLGVSDSGHVTYWSSSNTATSDRNGKISGSFVINREWSGVDEIFVSFKAVSHYVPPLDTEIDSPNYNFRGSFKITGGTGFYEGISGAGTIAGTFQDHQYGDFDRAIEFVMMGKAFAR